MRSLLALSSLVLVLVATPLRSEEYKGATIKKIDEKLLITFDVGGKAVSVTAFPFLKGFDRDGKELSELGHGLRVLKVGNVVDFKTESMKLTGKPQLYISELRLIKGELQSIEVLQSVAEKRSGSRTRKPGEFDEPLTCTVVKAEPFRAVLLRGSDGSEVAAFPSFTKAIDAEGKELSGDDRNRIFKEGNVVEVRLAKASNNDGLVIKEARLLRGTLADAKPATTADDEMVTVYKGATMKMYGFRGSVIVVDGKEIAIGPRSPMTVHRDAKGEPISTGADIIAAFKPGALVDVILGPPPKRGDGRPTLRELRLKEPAK